MFHHLTAYYVVIFFFKNASIRIKVGIIEGKGVSLLSQYVRDDRSRSCSIVESLRFWRKVCEDARSYGRDKVLISLVVYIIIMCDIASLFFFSIEIGLRVSKYTQTNPTAIKLILIK